MISLEKLSLHLKDFSLRDINFTINKGEYFVLFGPNGSGKTLLLECICGLRKLSEGIVRIEGADVTCLDPAYRNIGYVPQDYALIPFKTVQENISFGLEARKLSRQCISQRVKEMVNLLAIEHIGERYPARLSGGERQKVALGRALAINPRILLLDEPLSALDEGVRDELCGEFKRIQKQRQMTIIHVCHSFNELSSVAERVGVLLAGSLVQTGTLRDICQNPRHPFLIKRIKKEGSKTDEDN